VTTPRGILATPPKRGCCDVNVQRLEAGRYHFPAATHETSSLELTAGQFQMILDGIDLSKVRRFQRFAAAAT
jgi:hypothetical protein